MNGGSCLLLCLWSVWTSSVLCKSNFKMRRLAPLSNQKIFIMSVGRVSANMFLCVPVHAPQTIKYKMTPKQAVFE